MAIFTVDRDGLATIDRLPVNRRRVHKARVLGTGYITGRCQPIWPNQSLIAFTWDDVTCLRCLKMHEKEILDRHVLMEVGSKPASETPEGPDQ